MSEYPILIRGPSKTKMVKFKAQSFGEARERAIMKFRNHFINYKFARNMDLIQAKVEAAARSKKEGIAMYLFNTGDEVEVTETEPTNKDRIFGKFVNGSEDKDYLKKLSEPTEQTVKKANGNLATVNKVSKKVKVMATIVKPAKKAAAKKAAKKVEKKSEKLWHEGLTPKATTLRFTSAQWSKLEKYADEHGGIQKVSHDALVKLIGL